MSRPYESMALQLQTLLNAKKIWYFQESEETMAELKNVYEREKVMLMEENKKCQFELERMAELNNRLQLEKRQFEEDYHELRNKKEAVAQWEAQISEIINWWELFSLLKCPFYDLINLIFWNLRQGRSSKFTDSYFKAVI